MTWCTDQLTTNWIHFALTVTPSKVAMYLDGIEQKIDIVFNNAGVALGRDCAVGTIDYEAWHTSLNTNVMGSMRVLETVLP